MEVRSVQPERRLITLTAAPYGEVSYLGGDPRGERYIHGCFSKSIRQRGARVPLCRAHEHRKALGLSQEWTDEPTALTGVFGVRQCPEGDEVLEEAREGYLPGASVGFEPLVMTRGADGVREIREARLLEVSLVVIPAYESARVVAVRHAQSLETLMQPFTNPPAVNLSPFPAPWVYDSAR
jgi:HK97 family phage prohead protease